MTALSGLIARLEAAKEGSRELDAKIHLAVGSNDLAAALIRSGHQFSGPAPGPHYTTSLDAALMLVPKGWWYMFHWQGHSTASCAQHSHLGAMCRGATPALAICIAALKAREAGR